MSLEGAFNVLNGVYVLIYGLETLTGEKENSQLSDALPRTTGIFEGA